MVTRLFIRTIPYNQHKRIAGLLIIIAALLFPIKSIAQSGTFRFFSSPKNKTFFYSVSSQGMRQLAYVDLQIVKVLQENQEELCSNPIVQQASNIYLQDFYSGNGMEFKNNFTKAQAWTIAKNPIASYRTIRRMAKLLPDLVLHPYKIFDILPNESCRFLPKGLPDQTDLMEAIEGILRLQVTYNLAPNALSNGNISGMLTKAKLDAVHCYEIGIYAFEAHLHHYSQAVDWLELSLNKLSFAGDASIKTELVATAFVKAVQKHDQVFNTAKISDPHIFNEKIQSLVNHGTFSKRQTKRTFDYRNYKTRPERRKTDADFDYISLCNGENLQSIEEKSKLFCWLEFKAHERFWIGPLKMEFLARNPDLVQIHNFIGDTLIEQMRNEAAENMNMSVVLDNVDEGANVSELVIEKNTRVSENSWLNDREEEYLPLAQLISHVTGLETVTQSYCEYIQVASYTPSGRYNPHIDSGLPVGNQEGAGDRIGTFMIYLSDVEVGGYTAFPILGVSAKPVKGSAVFWYGVRRDEAADESTLHGGCPVVIGQKYIANKWIHYNDQFLTHKCSTNPQDRFEVRMNGKAVRQHGDPQFSKTIDFKNGKYILPKIV